MNYLAKKFFTTNLILFVGILFSYLIARLAVLNFFSNDRGYDYIIRDGILNVPRTVGLFATLFLLKRISGNSFKITSNHLILTTIVFFLLSISVYFQGRFVELYPLSESQLVIFSLGSFIVGYFEEFLFRGLLLIELNQKMHYGTSILVMSAIFSVYHYGMQPLYTFPFLFMFGVLLGQLVRLNVSLFWLGLFHGIYDMLWGIWYPVSELNSHIIVSEFMWICFLNALVFAYSKSTFATRNARIIP